MAIWETSSAIARSRSKWVHVPRLELRKHWMSVCSSPHFSHGAPEGIGAGISFGLAAHLEAGNDYIGRPINIASRLCSACPAGRVYVDKKVPENTGST